ncbi:unnamed protein product [Periconia digitata]|uniref:Uncharacterized protein n=1 Tax=Periconia digitata TaxID=1303443 RepID=A0A9W4UIH9_9PLEO|nr:unnamed protein product [Periconia digitata]
MFPPIDLGSLSNNHTLLILIIMDYDSLAVSDFTMDNVVWNPSFVMSITEPPPSTGMIVSQPLIPILTGSIWDSGIVYPPIESGTADTCILDSYGFPTNETASSGSNMASRAFTGRNNQLNPLSDLYAQSLLSSSLDTRLVALHTNQRSISRESKSRDVTPRPFSSLLAGSRTPRLFSSPLVGSRIPRFLFAARMVPGLRPLLAAADGSRPWPTLLHILDDPGPEDFTVLLFVTFVARFISKAFGLVDTPSNRSQIQNYTSNHIKSKQFGQLTDYRR